MKHNVNSVTSRVSKSAAFDMRLNVRESRAEHVWLYTLCVPAVKISIDAAPILHKIVLLEKKNLESDM